MIEIERGHKLKVKVLGIGGMGCRVIEDLISEGFDPGSCLSIYTQERKFKECGQPNKIYLWENREHMSIVGGRHFQIPHASKSCEPLLHSMLSGYDVALIAAGMASTEELVAAPCLAEACHKAGATVVSICCLLSLSENQSYSRIASVGLKKMSEHSDLTILISRDDVKRLFTEQKTKSVRNFIFHLMMATDAVQTLADIFLGGCDTTDSYIKEGRLQMPSPETVGHMGFGFGDTLTEAVRCALSCPLIESKKDHREIGLIIARFKLTASVTEKEILDAIEFLDGLTGHAYPYLISMRESDFFAREAILFKWELPDRFAIASLRRQHNG